MVALRLAFVALTVPGPNDPRWLDELPWSATMQGYSAYRIWERGRALRWFSTPRTDPAGPVLIDRWHSRKQADDQYLGPSARSYSQMHGYGRAFDPARKAGVDLRQLRGKLAWDAPGALDGASALFINLPSGDGPGFRWSEVRAIVAFVQAGGGLLLIADHTDCYAHQDMLAQLSSALGFRLLPVTAADPAFGLGVRAKSWISTSMILPHPVTAGVERLGWMNAGGVEGLVPLVQSSPQSWADRFEPHRRADSAGFTGDLEHGPDEVGPVTLAAAGEVGAGRVVVLADQNAFGATMIGFADNQRLFNQALGWVARREIKGLPAEVSTIGEGCADAYEQGFRSLQVAVAARARDACASSDLASRRILLPSAFSTPSTPTYRTVRLTPDVAILPLIWSAAGEVLATDQTGKAVVRLAEGELHVSSSLLNNTALGNETADPQRWSLQAGHRVKAVVLDWLLQPAWSPP